MLPFFCRSSKFNRAAKLYTDTGLTLSCDISSTSPLSNCVVTNQCPVGPPGFVSIATSIVWTSTLLPPPGLLSPNEFPSFVTSSTVDTSTLISSGGGGHRCGSPLRHQDWLCGRETTILAQRPVLHHLGGASDPGVVTAMLSSGTSSTVSLCLLWL